MRGIDHCGQIFGRLTVLEQAPRRPEKDTYRYWLCKCECGKELVVNGNGLRRGSSRSCGCLALELRAERMRQQLTTHGMSGTYLHRAWFQMRSRCSNPRNSRFHQYGGRGITVCARWLDSFLAFAEDMGPRPTERHSLDRIDVNGNYEPGNCRWATVQEQNTNTTRTRLYVFNGEEMTSPEAARRYGIPRSTMERRLTHGYPPNAAILPKKAFQDWLQQSGSKA